MTTPPRVANRRFWSYLRLFLQVMAVLLVAFAGWFGWILYTAKVQHDAVVAIQAVGGRIDDDWVLRSHLTGPWWLRWLVDHLGADCFSNVIRVNLDKGGSDAQLVHVGRLGSLYLLSLRGSSVTDAGLAHLRGLNQLEELYLGDTAITDAGLVHLSRLTNLRRLDLWNTRISDEGLAHLRGLTNLRTLTLDGTRITGPGLTHLQGLSHLEWVSLRRNRVAKSQAEELRKTVSQVWIDD